MMKTAATGSMIFQLLQPSPWALRHGLIVRRVVLLFEWTLSAVLEAVDEDVPFGKQMDFGDGEAAARRRASVANNLFTESEAPARDRRSIVCHEEICAVLMLCVRSQ